jgi:hypothetical protein
VGEEIAVLGVIGVARLEMMLPAIGYSLPDINVGVAMVPEIDVMADWVLSDRSAFLANQSHGLILGSGEGTRDANGHLARWCQIPVATGQDKSEAGIAT